MRALRVHYARVCRARSPAAKALLFLYLPVLTRCSAGRFTGYAGVRHHIIGTDEDVRILWIDRDLYDITADRPLTFSQTFIVACLPRVPSLPNVR